MSRYRIVLDQARCINCKACEVHCKAYHNVPHGIKRGTLHAKGPFNEGGVPRLSLCYETCVHCDDPACVPACPTGAMIRRDSDGIVYVDAELCIGCKKCIKACPWHIPQLHKESQTIMKCDYCRERLDKGLLPVCVTACTTHALRFEESTTEGVECSQSLHSNE